MQYYFLNRWPNITSSPITSLAIYERPQKLYKAGKIHFCIYLQDNWLAVRIY